MQRHLSLPSYYADVTYRFERLGLIRIYAGVFDENVASQRALKNAGFEFEGISKKAIIKNDQLLDEYRFSILNNDQ